MSLVENQGLNEDETKHLLAGTSDSVHHDLFRHENASVDLLLKEMNFDPSSIVVSDDVPVSDMLSLNNSPTKPLNFPGSSQKPHIDTNKEYNSSSDTYTSETEQSPKNEETKITKPTTSSGAKDSSFHRNFDLDDSIEAQKTIARPTTQQEDEFSFVTPMTSAVDLSNPGANGESDSIPNYINASPSRSIMKKTQTSSPKKNVVFTNSNPEIHHYPDSVESASNNESFEASHNSTVQVTPISHGWSELNHDKSMSSDDESSTPPAPPPHSTKSYEELLNNHSESNPADDEIDPKTLNEVRLRHNSFSNLSLNEKLDLFLTNKNDNEPFNGSNTNDLDGHLNDLQSASQHKTNSNIHSLSLSLQNPKQEVENPLNALANADVELRSSGSSQSSLPSLRDHNRTLDSISNQPNPKSLQLNDGIKGFSDDLVEALIPTGRDHAPIKYEKEEEDEGLTIKSGRTQELSNFSQDTPQDSYDNSYDNNTEQSIMNLLKSASGNDLASTTPAGTHLVEKSLKPVENGNIKKELSSDEPLVPLEASHDVKVKDEPLDEHFDAPEELVNEERVKLETNNNGKIVKDLSSNDLKSYLAGPIEPKIKSEESVHRTIEKPQLSPVESSKTKDVKGRFTKSEEVDDDSSDSVRSDSSKMSIRFKYDSDWKLEDSHDGDNEDNEDYTINDVTVASLPVDKKFIDFEHLKRENPSVVFSGNESANVSQEFKDASDNLVAKTLAPPRAEAESKESDDDDDLENVLANSSNVAPPEEITLPPVEMNNYSSFDEITKTLDKVTYDQVIVKNPEAQFEESLSAEHEADPKPTNLFNIWHLQEKVKKDPKNRVRESLTKDGDISPFLATSTIGSKNSKFKIPASLQPKKFTDVVVKSRRVVSPGYEDLNVSQFLPELSQDSGFKEHFDFLEQSSLNYSNIPGDRRSITPLSFKNMLTNLDSDPNVIEPPLPPVRKGIRASNNVKLAPVKGKPARSKFKVPSFEIQRSTSALSPRDTYNDIFEDVVKQAPPTIKASGMKTLPSMDSEDVKRILNTKRVITQEEYSRAKLVGKNPKKNSVVEQPSDKYDDLQQHASICDISVDSSPMMEKQLTDNDSILPHLADELKKAPTALLLKEQYFNEDVFKGKEVSADIGTQPVRASSVVHRRLICNPVSQVFPEPDPELINTSPKDTVFKTPPRKNNNFEVRDELLDRFEYIASMAPNVTSPKKEIAVSSSQSAEGSPPKKPIKISSDLDDFSAPRKFKTVKIGSPLKLVKKGSSVKGVEVVKEVSSSRSQKSQGSFQGDEITNTKLRESPIKSESSEKSLETRTDILRRPNGTKSLDLEKEQHKASYVSMPSVYTNGTSQSTAVSTALQLNNFVGNEEHPQLTAANKKGTPPPALQERGRMFLRVVGFKNIELPHLKEHKANFSITLDNGVHCIRTPDYKLNSNNIPIGKEFELTVGESLEFILTMKASYEKPKGRLVEVTERKVVKSKGKIGRMFGSKEIVTTTKFVPVDVKDTWENKFAHDGSFARCYVDLEQYEAKITGKALSFDLTCFNEWETTPNVNGGKEPVRCKPYRIGQLEVKMLFVPRTDALEVLPTSIKSAYESIHELGHDLSITHEGFMHQEGGDCEIWKRRFFKLQGTSLIAHSEYSLKTRAKINLAKVVDVIYVDKENFNNSSANYRNFSDVLLVEHAFKIRFANGEIIDFGAPNKEQKNEWISIFERIVYRNRFRKQPWVKLMLQETGYISRKEAPKSNRSSMAF
ncbi:integrin alpha chain-like protein [Scheffersomyces xylosifermentans]|uniref:integrin alpha chain-like protein n=1 Tax=Scheffersomyces xylosifermentans TaxID=1304137 RepID=UPI00315D506D